MPETRKAAPDWHREAALEDQRTRIIRDRRLHTQGCAGCGIALNSSSTLCPTCAAWRRWFLLRQLAAEALREATAR